MPPRKGSRPPSESLATRFPDLSRHFVFEYYPWYATNPYRHWNDADRQPPADLASNYMPRLGAYDSASPAVLEQHAKWIKDAGAGAINVSWWGRADPIDRLIPRLMDVMSDHDIRVTFHLEPYATDHAQTYARDVEYLVSEYGDRRQWDCLLLLQQEDGHVGPVFKSFRTILPPRMTDCHGVATSVPDYAPDSIWRQQTDRVRTLLAGSFDRVTLLADSLDAARVQACGFDGIAVYDNFVEPATWDAHARACTSRDLVFSFNVNPGFDGVALRHVDPGSCDAPLGFEPGRMVYDWSIASARQAAASASRSRLSQSFRATLAVQTDPRLANYRRGFFLTYINSFNEWHEGHQFEPMKDRADLTDQERALGYHNPEDGRYRLDALGPLLADVVARSI